MIDPKLINPKDAKECLGVLLDKIPKAKKLHVFVEAACVEATIGALARLTKAVEDIFPPDDWARYERAQLAETMTLELTITKAEFLALRDALALSKGEGK